MKVLKSVKELSLHPKALCIGNFDGMHRGHQALVKEMIACAPGLERVVLSFHPHPVEVLNPERKFFKVQQWSEMPTLLGECGVDTLILQEFTKSFTELGAEEFIVDWLAPHINPRFIVVGENFNFGYGQEGDVNFLKRYEAKFNFKVITVPDVVCGGEKVSSTLVREYLSKGDMVRVHQLLGRPYFLEGFCQRGAGQGRELGFPTLNIPLEQNLSIGPGVYVCYLVDRLSGRQYPSVANIGRAPTVHENRDVILEVHVLDGHSHKFSTAGVESSSVKGGYPSNSFDVLLTKSSAPSHSSSLAQGNFDTPMTKVHEKGELDLMAIQGKVRVKLIHFLRREISFSSKESLICQIKKDVEKAKNFFAKLNRNDSPPCNCQPLG